MDEKVKELALSDALTSAYLILQDCRKLKTSLALEHQVAQRCRVDQEREFRALMNEFRVTLDQIQADHKVRRQYLDLFGSEAGSEKDARRTGTHS